jgi:peptide/nickel transport system permease protein
MLRYALRRVLWALPTLLGISLVVFFLTTLLPDPSAGVLAAGSTVLGDDPERDAKLEEERRSRFLDLPRFFNDAPQDVRTRALAAVGDIAAAADDEVASRRLEQLGGAALPYVLPALEGLAPEARGKVALVLMPVAARMDLTATTDTTTADQAVLFWSRFWEDRALEFTEPAVDRAVSRLVEHGSDTREHDLLSLDTYALPQLMVAMQTTEDRVALARLTRVAAHVSRRGMEIPETAGDTFVRRALGDWEEWWYVHDTDFVALDGASRIAAMLGETRYGKWVMRAFTGRLGMGVDHEPIASKMRLRAPVTLLITLEAMLASYAIAVPIAIVAAWRRGRTVDTVTAAVLFALYSLPTFWTAEILERAFRSSLTSDSSVGPLRLVLPVVTLTLAAIATLSRYQRAALVDALGQDYVRTARAKGVPTWRVLVVHALRNALLPMLTLAGLQLPALLGGAFVVEETFGVPGLGYETVRAVEARDAGWLICVVVTTAIVTTVGLIASDVMLGVLDPRVREMLLAGPRRDAS